MIRTYSELSRYSTFEERYDYLNLHGLVGEETFGVDRYLNQKFYRSSEWKRVRNIVLFRDGGCDLGLEGYDIFGKILIHHMNPMGVQDIVNFDPDILNPEFLVCVSQRTHNAIHYGDKTSLTSGLIERRPGDTRLW